MSEKAKDEDDEVPVPAKKSGSKVLPALAVLNTLLIAGVVVYVMKRPAAPAPAAVAGPAVAAGEKPAGEHGEHGKGLDAPGPTLKLENFIIQLRTTESERYVRVAFDIELASEADRDGVVARTSQIRDAVISYFADRTLEELRGSDGMDHIKQALLKRLDDVVTGHRLRAIYITEFIVQ
jgi:flagellar FliL protein